MSSRGDKIEALFEAAVALESDAQRSDFLDRACPDPELRREVESLLAAHFSPDTIFEDESSAAVSAREEEILQGALHLREAGTRDAFLTAACGGDAALRARIETRLAARLATGGIRATPSPTGEEAVVVEKPGDRIGRYKLLQPIGDGGMGSVWMA